MAHEDPMTSVEKFGFTTTLFGNRRPSPDVWQNAFTRAGAGRFRTDSAGDRVFEGFHVIDIEAIEVEHEQRDAVIYLTADPGFAEADLDKVCTPLAAQLGVAVVTQGQRSGLWFTLTVTNRPPKQYPKLRISRSQPALDVVDLAFKDGSGRVDSLTYGQELQP